MQLCMYVYKHRCKFVRLFVRKLMQARMFVRIYMDLCLYVSLHERTHVRRPMYAHVYSCCCCLNSDAKRRSDPLTLSLLGTSNREIMSSIVLRRPRLGGLGPTLLRRLADAGCRSIGLRARSQTAFNTRD